MSPQPSAPVNVELAPVQEQETGPSKDQTDINAKDHNDTASDLNDKNVEKADTVQNDTAQNDIKTDTFQTESKEISEEQNEAADSSKSEKDQETAEKNSDQNVVEEVSKEAMECDPTEEEAPSLTQKEPVVLKAKDATEAATTRSRKLELAEEAPASSGPVLKKAKTITA
eukprot:TRINITY_DN5257_c0_g1_i1.p1 TRINITY_DN5257_c0_g1~~TRINITY_DN5257_c0_g1_i1.p1  ORF type:complete len:170 (-),score=57.56 TRINITY_DN5257_c0_g1_i1:164-673(-)